VRPLGINNLRPRPTKNEWNIIMIKLNNFKVFGFVIILIGAITFTSINFLEAKKARSGESWKERISGCGECNSSQVLFENALSPSNTHYWVKTYGCSKDAERWDPHHVYFSIQQTKDGGYILADAIHPPGHLEYADIWVLKLDSNGVIDWHRCYGEDLIEESCPTIKTTDDGGYIVLSLVYPSSIYGPSDAWIFKLDSTGDIEWQKIYGGTKVEKCVSIQQTRDGGYIVTGYTGSFGPHGLLVLKLDSTGDIEWQHVYYEGKEEVNSCDIQPTNDGGYIVLSGNTLNGNLDVWVLKLDANGFSEWQRTYGGPEIDYGRFAIQETRDGGYIVNCRTESFYPTRAIWILKLTREGKIEWQRAYDGHSTDWGEYIRQTNDGGYLFGGGTVSFGAGRADILILKLDPYGFIEWQRTYGESEGDVSWGAIQQIDDGGFIIGGWSESFGNNKLFLLKLPPDGDISDFCGITDIPHMTSIETFVNPVEVNVLPVQSSIVPRSTHIQPEEINAYEELICWNLNQAPVNVSLKRDVNRSVFTKEAFYIISWSPNPANNQFDIMEYRIYRAEATSERYELLGVVSGDIFEYVDGYLDLDATFYYTVTSVDSEGHESPKSSSVTGEPSEVN